VRIRSASLIYTTSLSKVVLLLVVSNVFMLSAWYLHLKYWADRPWYTAAFLSWCIAFLEYAVHIPANRIGHTLLTLPQLQILQVGLSLFLFIPFATLVMKRSIGMDYVWASVCLLAAAFFIFRENSRLPMQAMQTPNLEISQSEPYRSAEVGAIRAQSSGILDGRVEP
jgi:uncharacterized protein